MRALISVSDKEGIVEFAKDLVSCGYEIISTGGTYSLLLSNGLKVLKVDEITKFHECFDGRVKTLHPNIHGGILYKREDKNHSNEAEKLGIKPIDIVCVNLYPFKETIEDTDDFDTIIENIDIGGPAMIRSSAKNFKDVIVITDKRDYKKTITYIKSNQNSIEFRENMMIKAFEHTASYDAMIANYMNKRFCDNFGQKKFIVGDKLFDTRYGENPHQKGALYQFENYWTKNFKSLKGEPSFNNMADISSAVLIVSSFKDKDAVAIVKHGNPCGFALGSSLVDSYDKALICDPLSAFGGVVAVNGIVDGVLASKLSEIFFEVVIAGDFTKEAIDILNKKAKIKLFSQNSNRLKASDDLYSFKNIEGGFVYQTKDNIKQNEIINSIKKSKQKATPQQISDMTIAYILASLTKSNCVTYVKDGVLVAIGMGMTSRVDAAIAATNKAKKQNISLIGSSMASEAFFPFRDSIDEANLVGVKSIIQPGGSIRDDEIIKAVDEYNIALYFTNTRHFLH